MGLFDRLKNAVFLKDDSDAERQLAQLEELNSYATGNVQQEIQRDIMLLQAGIAGEKQVHFELENSHIPMYVIHDLYLEYEGWSAQIDYLIITHMHQYVVECKNLYGDIDINTNGDFVRTFSYGRFRKKEGIYSPITQNRRHMELIKEMRGAEKGFLVRGAFERNFFNNYRSIVVLSNPKTVLNAKYAKKDVRNQVIRVDQLAEYIRKTDKEPGAVSCSEKDMEKLAKYFLDKHKQNPMDYTEKYRKIITMPETKYDEEETGEAASDTVEQATSVVSDQPKSVTPVQPLSDNDQAEESNAENSKNAQATESNMKNSENAQEADSNAEKSENDQIICPRCGGPMVKRLATRGKNAGNYFYGCANFPKCRGIINIEN